MKRLRFRSVVGGALVGVRDYLCAEEVVIPKGLRGPVPVQTDGWPPTVDGHFYVLPRWLKLWLVLAPVLLGAGGVLAWRSVEGTIRDEGERARLAIHHQEAVDAGEHGRK